MLCFYFWPCLLIRQLLKRIPYPTNAIRVTNAYQIHLLYFTRETECPMLILCVRNIDRYHWQLWQTVEQSALDRVSFSCNLISTAPATRIEMLQGNLMQCQCTSRAQQCRANQGRASTLVANHGLCKRVNSMCISLHQDLLLSRRGYLRQ